MRAGLHQHDLVTRNPLNRDNLRRKRLEPLYHRVEMRRRHASHAAQMTGGEYKYLCPFFFRHRREGLRGRPFLRCTDARHSDQRGQQCGQESARDQNSTGPSSSFTCQGSPCSFSMSMNGSGSNCSMLNTPSPAHLPVIIIAAPIIAGTPVV